jgi:hypothetical protein
VCITFEASVPGLIRECLLVVDRGRPAMLIVISMSADNSKRITSKNLENFKPICGRWFQLGSRLTPQTQTQDTIPYMYGCVI